MNGKKIFNDPVYGFVSVPYGIIFKIIEHPHFQRLRRIKQVSLTHYVYPGALHTRFHHALGAFHLMTQAIEVLRAKGNDISDEEAEAAFIAILMHDIGHGPFSHTLENTLIPISHEALSALIMGQLNGHFEGALSLALQIFQDKYPKKFLHQLVSGQLDMDRMDYLNRDSFFTGVYEGVIGYDRIIKMLAVREGELVVEEKGIYSVEKFLIARRLMYWQVYLHKTVLSAEQMLVQTLRRARELARSGMELNCSENLAFFLYNDITADQFRTDSRRALDHFLSLDDYDIISALKSWTRCEDQLLAFLSQSLLQRRLFRLELSNRPFDRSYVESVRSRVAEWSAFGQEALRYLVFEGKETNNAYSTSKDEIKILHKSGLVLPMSESADYGIHSQLITKYYLCYPKGVLRDEG
jgi:HD superfamily phosphohydrolase